MAIIISYMTGLLAKYKHTANMFVLSIIYSG